VDKKNERIENRTETGEKYGDWTEEEEAVTNGSLSGGNSLEDTGDRRTENRARKQNGTNNRSPNGRGVKRGLGPQEKALPYKYAAEKKEEKQGRRERVADNSGKGVS